MRGNDLSNVNCVYVAFCTITQLCSLSFCSFYRLLYCTRAVFLASLPPSSPSTENATYIVPLAFIFTTPATCRSKSLYLFDILHFIYMHLWHYADNCVWSYLCFILVVWTPIALIDPSKQRRQQRQADGDLGLSCGLATAQSLIGQFIPIPLVGRPCSQNKKDKGKAYLLNGLPFPLFLFRRKDKNLRRRDQDSRRLHPTKRFSPGDHSRLSPCSASSILSVERITSAALLWPRKDSQQEGQMNSLCRPKYSGRSQANSYERLRTDAIVRILQ